MTAGKHGSVCRHGCNTSAERCPFCLHGEDYIPPANLFEIVVRFLKGQP